MNQIREWTKDDIPRIAELEKRCFSDPWTEADFLGCLAVPVYKTFLLEENGVLIGYACQSVVFEDSEILNIAVAPEYRGQRYGQLLMKMMLRTAMRLKASNLFLEVRESNAPARGLYEFFAFKEYGVRKNYYPDGEDAILMKRTI
jgi:ribosomal-protein-alanine N-acetyltransferase